MEFIIDFYKSLDTLNLIIFWGIITVIILLLIFSFILINKNKKLKSLIEKNNELEDLPIKKTEANQPTPPEESKKVPQHNFIEPPINEIEKEEKNETEIISKQIQTEKNFIAEEHVMEYNKEAFSLSNIQKANEQKEEVTNHDTKRNAPVQIPTGPYQRNVLREMSLSQTSPIGITKPIQKETKKIEIAKDLEQSLNSESVISQNEYNNNNNKLLENTETRENKQITNQIKKELTNVENTSPRKTTIITENIHLNKTVKYESKNNTQEECKTNKINYMDMVNIETPAKELLNLEPQISKEKNQKTSSEKYLEEVSQKLAEAEVPDEIERTNYELKQEEEAIISYKELMEKKDSIQTIDEEEAVISIEELMNRKKQEEEKNQKTSSEKNLEEVSQKLAEAEDVPDGIERTNYELKQEEEAIISYKELMEKKDSIQTIDEEEAVISMEELMSHQKKQEEKNKYNNKLYNFSEEEENEKFIKELKQFRNDL